MKKTLISIFLLTMSCCGSSVFIEEAEPLPDFRGCYRHDEVLVGVTDYTPIALPFAGRRAVTLFTPLPDGWDQFHGSVHLVELKWNLDWVKNATLIVGPFIAADLGKDGKWVTYPRTDLMDALSVHDGEWLRFRSETTGKGWKPAGTQEIRVEASVQLCGEGAEGVSIR